MSSKTIWIDTETTGVIPSENAVIQIAMMVEINGKILDRVVYTLKPFDGDVIEDKALEVNGITREQLDKYPDPKEVFPMIMKMLNSHIDQYDRSDKFIVAGYNTQFDMDFLRALWDKMGHKYFGSYFYHKPIDIDAIVVLINRLKGELPQYAKLIDALKRFGIDPPEDLHDAMADIVYTRKLYGKVMQVLKDTLNSIETS